MLNSNQVAEKLAVCERTVWRWVESGFLKPPLRFAHRSRWPETVIEDFVKKGGVDRVTALLALQEQLLEVHLDPDKASPSDAIDRLITDTQVTAKLGLGDDLELLWHGCQAGLIPPPARDDRGRPLWRTSEVERLLKCQPYVVEALLRFQRAAKRMASCSYFAGDDAGRQQAEAAVLQNDGPDDCQPVAEDSRPEGR